MPRVSEQYLASRRDEILTAARRCFVRNGFHATSMQDIFAASGLSAGAVYRYFRSKDDMVLAIAEDNIRELATTLQVIAGEEDRPLGDAVASALEALADKDAEEEITALAIQVWAEALRNPALRRALAARLQHVRADLADVLRHRRLRVSAEDAAGAMIAVLPGYILQRALLGRAAVDGMADALRALLR